MKKYEKLAEERVHEMNYVNEYRQGFIEGFLKAREMAADLYNKSRYPDPIELLGEEEV